MTGDVDVLSIRISAKRLPQPLLKTVRRVFNRLLGFQKFNAIYNALPPHTAEEFPHTLLEAMGVDVEYSGLSHDRIPKAGPLIVIANHPFGLIEGIALDAFLQKRRPDVIVMATYWLAAIPEFQARYAFVDPQRSRRRRKLNRLGWRHSLKWIARDGVLLVFPAGRVARFRWRNMSVTDQPWSPHIAELARRTHTPVLPVYFHGRNSLLFHLVGLLSPPLQNLLLVREIINKRGMRLRATVGRLIEPGDFSVFPNEIEATRFLRQMTEALAHSHHQKK